MKTLAILSGLVALFFMTIEGTFAEDLSTADKKDQSSINLPKSKKGRNSTNVSRKKGNKSLSSSPIKKTKVVKTDKTSANLSEAKNNAPTKSSVKRKAGCGQPCETTLDCSGHCRNCEIQNGRRVCTRSNCHTNCETDWDCPSRCSTCVQRPGSQPKICMNHTSPCVYTGCQNNACCSRFHINRGNHCNRVPLFRPNALCCRGKLCLLPPPQ